MLESHCELAEEKEKEHNEADEVRSVANMEGFVRSETSRAIQKKQFQWYVHKLRPL